MKPILNNKTECESILFLFYLKFNEYIIYTVGKLPQDKLNPGIVEVHL